MELEGNIGVKNNYGEVYRTADETIEREENGGKQVTGSEWLI